MSDDTDDVAPNHEHHLPPWLRPGDPESRWATLTALIVAMALQLAVPDQYTVVPRWPLITLEALLLAVLVLINPTKFTRTNAFERTASMVLLAAITLDNIASAVVLDVQILTGKVSQEAELLLGSGGAVFLTNIIVFGIWYWEMDLGGPFARGSTDRKLRHPDFLFPQTDNPRIAGPDWAPRFADYLYVSFTNVVAFSPTDTMPLTRRAKSLMALQSMVAVSTLALVIARAVNVLK